jgi:23S rRNA (uracil1939-C5)-methyltransferase
VAPSAVTIACVHAARCSGCALIGAPYGEQLVRKRAELAAALAPYWELRGLAPAATRAAEPVTEYRARAKLVASGTALGLFARGSHDVVDIPACRVLSPKVARVVAALRAELPLPFALVGVDVREVDEGALVTLIVAEDARQSQVQEAAERLRTREPSVVGVAVSRNPRGSPRLLGALPKPLLGATSAPHHLAAGEPFQEAAFGSFVQAHPAQASALYTAVQQAVESRLGTLRGLPVLELYAGSGALAMRLARAGAEVTAVESFAPAAEAILRAARAQDLQLRALAQPAELALQSAAGARAVVLDPPRRGLSPPVRRALGALRPEIVVYVSCSPATLARDLAHLAQLGLTAESITPFDMIPLSDAVEAVAVLTPNAPPAPRIVHEEESFLTIDKPPFLPTAPHGAADSLLARVRALPGLSEVTAVHPLDPETSGLCVFARGPNWVNSVTLALAAGAQSYLTLVRGIVRSRGTLRHPLRDGPKRREASTRYRRVRVAGTHSLVQATTEREHLHQVRRHFAGVGHPVLGDERYGDSSSNRYFAERHGLDRPFVHVTALELALDDRRVPIEGELAPDLAAVLRSLESL